MLVPLVAGACNKVANRPDIVFIVIDTLRADRLGAYGDDHNHTPALDALAKEGVTFERAIAQAPWTQPSMASLFCACNPAVHQVLDFALALRNSAGTAAKSNIRRSVRDPRRIAARGRL